MEFKEIVTRRFASKKYLPKQIPEPVIDDLIEIVRFAPSAFNLQPWKIKMISDPELKKALQPETMAGKSQVATCSHLLILFADTDVESLMEKISGAMKQDAGDDEEIERMMGIARAVVLRMTPDERAQWAKYQVFIALSNAVNGAASLGIDACPITGFNPSGYIRVLNLEDHLIPTAVVSLGYAADDPKPKIRFSREDIII
jgi:nitroreductase